MKFRKIKTIPINDLKVGQYFVIVGSSRRNVKLLFKSLNDFDIKNAKDMVTKIICDHVYHKDSNSLVDIYKPINNYDDMALDFL